MNQAETFRHRQDARTHRGRNRTGPAQNRLCNLYIIGPNPGRLRARVYVPGKISAGAPLVVVLHGCLQTASDYDEGSGWSKLADLYGFVLLFPQQRRFNNPLRGFNWFRNEDSRRDAGEPRSIVDMVTQVAMQHGTDPRRVFVTGLSAGGAMASVLLATYPDVFAGGAIIAGLPYRSPSTIQGAFRRMQGQDRSRSAGELALDVREACGGTGPWPIVSVWHGEKDCTVDPLNTQLIVDQWRELHGLDLEPTCIEDADGHTRRAWKDPSGREIIEEYRIAGMGHGAPVLESEHEGREAVAFMLDGTISSTRRIADFWGLLAVQACPVVA